ncbi:recombinase family protein [Janibacter indicus]|uniref:recombinase family protein n=1 Tax=Janibacter indicus TaxID=857417 RepID=UPI003D9AA955
MADLGVDAERIYTDKRTGRSMKNRPGLTQAIAALRPGDALVVTKLDRLARSVPDARNLVGQVYEKGAALQLGPSLHDPNDPVGKFLFNALAMVAEFEADLNRQRTMEGLAIAREQGRLLGKPPKLNERRTKKLLQEYEAGMSTVAQLADDYAVSRATIYRTIQRAKAEKERNQ